jgi:enoyl-CoA hydratase/carnithine racemase
MTSLTTETRNHTLWIRVDRPEAHNAVDFTVMQELEQVVSQVESNDQIRTLIISGTGHDSFISGGDLKKFHQLTSKEEATEMAQRMHQLLLRIESLPCWTIACVNGQAYGGGCEIALAFDFRIASRSVRFGFTQARFYLPPGWGGLTRLVETVGRPKALEWLGSASVIDALEAEKWGLVNKLEDTAQLEPATWEWADRLGKNDRTFIQNLKQQSRSGFSNHEKALQAEIEPFAEFWADDRHLDRVESFLNRKR